MMTRPPSDTSGLQCMVEVSNTQPFLALDQIWIERIVRTVCNAEHRDSAEISIAIVDNAAIRIINAQYLNHDRPTDVISFPDLASSDQNLAGELIVSAEMAQETAAQGGNSPLDELALYLVHGLLHLCGYNDQNPTDIAVIRSREDEILRQLDISNPFDLPDVASSKIINPERESVRWPR